MRRLFVVLLTCATLAVAAHASLAGYTDWQATTPIGSGTHCAELLEDETWMALPQMDSHLRGHLVLAKCQAGPATESVDGAVQDIEAGAI
jgi:hypothetical protein